MGLFSGWFSSKDKSVDQASYTDWRREDRRRISTAWPPVEARMGKSRAQVLDLSEAGFCLAIDESHAPERELVTISQGDDILARGYAMRVWRGGSRVGYTFASGLTVERLQEQRASQAAAQTAEQLPTRAAAQAAILEVAANPQETVRKQPEAGHDMTAVLEAVDAKLQEAKTQELAVAFPNDEELRAIQIANGAESGPREDLDPLPFDPHPTEPQRDAPAPLRAPAEYSPTALRHRLKR